MSKKEIDKLCMAAHKNDLAKFKNLIAHHILDICSESSDGSQPIHYAAAAGSMAVLKYITSVCLERNRPQILAAQNRKGNTALQLAKANTRKDALEHLLQIQKKLDDIKNAEEAKQAEENKQQSEVTKKIIESSSIPEPKLSVATVVATKAKISDLFQFKSPSSKKILLLIMGQAHTFPLPVQYAIKIIRDLKAQGMNTLVFSELSVDIDVDNYYLLGLIERLKFFKPLETLEKSLLDFDFMVEFTRFYSGLPKMTGESHEEYMRHWKERHTYKAMVELVSLLKTLKIPYIKTDFPTKEREKMHQEYQASNRDMTVYAKHEARRIEHMTKIILKSMPLLEKTGGVMFYPNLGSAHAHRLKIYLENSMKLPPDFELEIVATRLAPNSLDIEHMFQETKLAAELDATDIRQKMLLHPCIDLILTKNAKTQELVCPVLDSLMKKFQESMRSSKPEIDVGKKMKSTALDKALEAVSEEDANLETKGQTETSHLIKEPIRKKFI